MLLYIKFLSQSACPTLQFVRQWQFCSIELLLATYNHHTSSYLIAVIGLKIRTILLAHENDRLMTAAKNSYNDGLIHHSILSAPRCPTSKLYLLTVICCREKEKKMAQAEKKAKKAKDFVGKACKDVDAAQEAITELVLSAPLTFWLTSLFSEAHLAYTEPSLILVIYHTVFQNEPHVSEVNSLIWSKTAYSSQHLLKWEHEA